MQDRVEEAKAQVVRSEWYRGLSKYEKPNTRSAALQLLDTFVPYIALWALMIYIVKSGLPLWYLIPPIVLCGGLLVRVFIFFHDCGHGSFFASRTANKIVGFISGILTFTPYDDWRHQHAGHHAHAGDLERRGMGDVWTLTVEEYMLSSPMRKLGYRLYRNPIVLFVLGPPYMFLIGHRFAHKNGAPRERQSVYITNAALAAILVIAHFTIGLKAYLLIQIPMITIAGATGIWMFYVQHQYEEVYWEHHDEWDPIRAALAGSSYYKLPKVLQWFSGNIGLHHIHHLRPRIPNYNLQKSFDETPELQRVEPLTLGKSLGCIWLNLWDESNRRMVGFRHLKAYRTVVQRS